MIKRPLMAMTEHRESVDIYFLVSYTGMSPLTPIIL